MQKAAQLLAVTLFLSGDLMTGRGTATKIRGFRITAASVKDAVWLKRVLDREGRAFGTGVEQIEGNRLKLRWSTGGP